VSETNGACGCVCHATHKIISLRLSLPLTSSARDDQEKGFIRGKKRRNAGRDSDVTCS